MEEDRIMFRFLQAELGTRQSFFLILPIGKQNGGKRRMRRRKKKKEHEKIKFDIHSNAKGLRHRFFLFTVLSSVSTHLLK